MLTLQGEKKRGVEDHLVAVIPGTGDRIGMGLKVFANDASYGVYAEMHPQDSNEEMEVQRHGIDPAPFTCRVAHPDVPGVAVAAFEAPRRGG